MRRYRSIILFPAMAAWLCWLALLFCSPGPAAADYVLPDTGQTKCYDGSKVIPCPEKGDDYFGQDGSYEGIQPAYKYNGDGTVSDLNTGLMWQQADSQNSSGRTWDSATSYCDSLALAGFTDWRLPTVTELVSLVNVGSYDPSIDKVFFPQCRSGYYWSGRSIADNPGGAWSVYFYNGSVGASKKSGAYYVRCVRGGP